MSFRVVFASGKSKDGTAPLGCATHFVRIDTPKMSERVFLGERLGQGWCDYVNLALRVALRELNRVLALIRVRRFGIFPRARWDFFGKRTRDVRPPFICSATFFGVAEVVNCTIES